MQKKYNQPLAESSILAGSLFTLLAAYG